MTKLTVNEKARLKELSRFDTWFHSGQMAKTTNSLIDRGFLELRGRKTAKSGRLIYAGEVRITDAGREALKAAGEGNV